MWPKSVWRKIASPVKSTKRFLFEAELSLGENYLRELPAGMKPRIKETRPQSGGIGHGSRAFTVRFNGECRYIEVGAWRGMIDGQIYDQAITKLRWHISKWALNPDGHFCSGVDF